MPSVRDRERILKSLLILIVGMPFAILFWLQPAPPKPDPDNKAHADRTKENPAKTTPAITNDPATPQPQSPKIESISAPEPPAPTIAELLAESRRKVATAREAFERTIDRTDTTLLTMFGGEEWKRVQEIQQQAELSSQPSISAELWKQADSALAVLVPQLLPRQKASELRRLEQAGDDCAFLAALREATKKYPAQFDPLWENVATWESRRWFELSQSEIQQMSPADPGFAEVWLAVADHHAMRNDLDASRTAIEQAWANVARMTQAVRAVESAFDGLSRFPQQKDSTSSSERLRVVASLIGQVSSKLRRAEFQADLAATAHERGDRTLADKSTSEATSGLNKEYAIAMRCRALVTSASPAQLLELCGEYPQGETSITDDRFPASTMAYAQVGLAAIRANERSAVWHSQWLAEAQQFDVAEYMAANPYARRLVAEVDLRQQKWQRAIITANNLADPSLRALVLYLVMQSAPADVPADIGLDLIKLRPSDRGALIAIAAYLSHHWANEESFTERLEWISQLPQASSRAAAYLALARRANSFSGDQPPHGSPKPKPDVTDPRSLLESAESVARTMQDSLSRAYSQLWIAVAWHRLQKPASYAQACERFDKEIFNAWRELWRTRPPATTTISAPFYPDQKSYLFKDEYRQQQEVIRRQKAIIECSLLMAECQAFHLHDPRRAIETALDTARASHSLPEAKPELRIRLRSIVESCHQECGLPSGLLDSAIDPVNNYLRMILLTTQGHLEPLKKSVQTIETNGPGRRYNLPDCLARGHAEIAKLAARSGNLEDYRAARRRALGLIETQKATDSIRLLLMEADALAGELELARQTKRSRERLPLYDTANRPLSTLCVELCRANRLPDAESLLSEIQEPFWRLRAMHAIAAGRLRQHPEDDHLQWADQLDDPFLRVAAYCGLALREIKVMD